jgi:hypothetical protein
VEVGEVNSLRNRERDWGGRAGRARPPEKQSCPLFPPYRGCRAARSPEGRLPGLRPYLPRGRVLLQQLIE